MTEDQQALINATEARQLLDNKHFKEAFQGVADYLEMQGLACDSNDEKRAHNVILCKQILWKIKREIERKVEEGDIARIRIEEAEKRSKFAVFRR